MEKTLIEQVNFIKQNTKKQSVLKKIDSMDCSLNSEDWVNDLLFLAKQVVKLGGSLYGKHNQNTLVFPFITSKEYSIRDLINRQKGSLQGIQHFWKELMTVNFETNTTFDVPVILVEGRHDCHVSSKIASNYYETITSPKEIVWFEASGHFPQWEESEKFNLLLSQII